MEIYEYSVKPLQTNEPKKPLEKNSKAKELNYLKLERI